MAVVVVGGGGDGGNCIVFYFFFTFLPIRVCRSGRFGRGIQRVRIKYLLLRNNAERKDHATEDT